MGPPKSRQVPRDWRYLGKHQRGSDLSPTGLSPSTEDLSRSLRLDWSFVTSFPTCKSGGCSHDPDTTTLAGLHSAGLGYFRFARRYSGSRGFFLLLGLLRCFSSPRSPLTPMYSEPASVPSTRGVSPFRYLRIKACLTAPRSFSQSCHVFRRFLAPEHPPCTLSSLTTITPLHRSHLPHASVQHFGQ